MELGGLLAGVRAAPTDLGTQLEGALDGRLRPAADAPPAYSVHLEQHTGGAARRLHLCFEGNRLVARSREPAPVLGALLGHLGTLAALDGDVALVDVAAFVRDGVAVLAPATLRTAVPPVDRAAARAGLIRVAAAGALIGLDDGRLVVAEPLPSGDLDAEPTGASPGRYPIAAWLLPGPDAEPTAVPTADAVWALRSLIHEATSQPPERTVFALAPHLTDVELLRGPSDGPAAIAFVHQLLRR